jgi:N-acetylglutamate synthase-like GNAT family acetyltransferase
MTATDMLVIKPYADALAPLFRAINVAWIEAMFRMEAADHEVLDHPRTKILEPGGDILFVESARLGIIGTGALKKTGEGAFELTKMAVLENARGQQAGAFLLQALVARAKALSAHKLYLLTSSKCVAAIHLYEKYGFVHDADIMRDYGASYARCNVAMRWMTP